MKKEKELKILCPFCNAPYTAEMEKQLYVGGYCETCGPNQDDFTGTIDIICSNCKKLVYRKEF